jgi:hypothetical protein
VSGNSSDYYGTIFSNQGVIVVGGGVYVGAGGGALDLDGSSKVEQNFARNFADLFPPGGKP